MQQFTVPLPYAHLNRAALIVRAAEFGLRLKDSDAIDEWRLLPGGRLTPLGAVDFLRLVLHQHATSATDVLAQLQEAPPALRSVIDRVCGQAQADVAVVRATAALKTIHGQYIDIASSRTSFTREQGHPHRHKQNVFS